MAPTPLWSGRGRPRRQPGRLPAGARWATGPPCSRCSLSAAVGIRSRTGDVLSTVAEPMVEVAADGPVIETLAEAARALHGQRDIDKALRWTARAGREL